MGIFDFLKGKNKSASPSVDGRRATIQAMVAMAAADGEIGEEEIEEIDSIYTRLTGQAVGANSISQIAGAFLHKKLSIEAMMANEREDLTESEIALVVKASYLVLMADGVSADEEKQKLNEIAAGLQLSDKQVEYILKDVK